MNKIIAPTPQYDGWVLDAYDYNISAVSLTGSWVVPASPPSYDAQVIYTFNGIQPDGVINQPVLGYGAFGTPSWQIESWYCDGVCAYSTPLNVSPKDVIVGTTVHDPVKAEWVITSRDVTTGASTVMTVGDDAAGGASGVPYAAVLETYYVSQCADYPSSIVYTGTTAIDTNGNTITTNGFLPGSNGFTPVSGGCGEGVTIADNSSITLNLIPGLGPPPVNGVCGPDQGVATNSAPATSGLCSVGTPSQITNTATQWLWSCSGNSSGATAKCSAPVQTKQAGGGVCGTANGVPTASKPSVGLCSSGTPSGVSSTISRWNWTCSGSPVANCSAQK